MILCRALSKTIYANLFDYLSENLRNAYVVVLSDGRCTEKFCFWRSWRWDETRFPMVITFTLSPPLTICSIGLDVFDRAYDNAFQELDGKQRQLTNKSDKCPSLAAVMSRRLFSSLELWTYAYLLPLVILRFLHFVAVVCFFLFSSFGVLELSNLIQHTCSSTSLNSYSACNYLHFKFLCPRSSPSLLPPLCLLTKSPPPRPRTSL